MPVVTLSPDPRGCILSFGIPMSPTERYKMLFLPSSVGCQRSQTFLAPNPEQTVPFDVGDVSDVRRTEAGRRFVRTSGRHYSSSNPPTPGNIMQYLAMISAVIQVDVYLKEYLFEPLT